MGQKGSHTWTIVVDYHRCPECGCINESRKEFRYELGKYLKEVSCDRCQTEFEVDKPYKPTFGPIWDQEWSLKG